MKDTHTATIITEKCKYCRYYSKPCCRKNAPIFYGHFTCFPVVKDTDFCGEWDGNMRADTEE